MHSAKFPLVVLFFVLIYSKIEVRIIQTHFKSHSAILFVSYSWLESFVGSKTQNNLIFTSCRKLLDNELASSLLTTCSRLVIIKPEKAMRTHPDIGLMTAGHQTCSKIAANRAFLALCDCFESSC